ncbi:MAG: hypothetical protein HYY40_01595 [Bacteroidetes bacterium]|nr:hypothetical protein [Bacteroidota bacterium]
MKLIPLISVIVALMLACGSNPNSQPAGLNQTDVHKVLAQEVIQTTNYTYLRVEENEIEQWLAVPKMEASAGGTYYYKGGGMLMKDFKSKELNRTFTEILFLEQVRSTPEFADKIIPPPTPHGADPHNTIPVTESKANTNVATDKKSVKIEPVKDGITIAELYKNKKSYSGKTVKVKGEVTKFNPYIMDKNWIHLQDGTDYSGKFDLTATTNFETKVGDIITLQGIIALDQDFGYGYAYELLMQDAKLVK